MNNFYENIKNPIDDEKVLDRIIEIYSSGEPFYRQLSKTYEKKYKKGEYFQSYSDSFYAMLFNKWKNRITQMPKEEFCLLYQNNVYGEDFIKLRRYLKTVADVKTKEEADKIMYGSKNDKELENAMDKYRYTAFGEGTGWNHIKSKYVTAYKDISQKVEHRLYLNLESVDIHLVAKRFIEKCDEKSLPYYFKFSPYADRDDTFVIYSSTENLKEYISILKEIEKEYPDMLSLKNPPPLLTGKIDSFIGYGSEPLKSGQESFNSVRTKHIEDCLKKIVYSYIRSHKNDVVYSNYVKTKITLLEHLAIYAALAERKKLLSHYERCEKIDMEEARDKNIPYDYRSTIKRLGFQKQDLNDPKFLDSCRKMFEREIQKYIDNPNQTKDPIPLIGNEKLYNYDFLNIMKKLLIPIKDLYPNCKKNIQKTIKDTSKDYGIDKDNYAFDTDKKEKIFEYYKTDVNEKPIYNEPRNNENIISAESLLNKLSYLYSKNEKMIIPGGYKISAYTYIKDIVIPLMPKNGIINLRNGSTLSIEEFIKKHVIQECQTRYDGDLAKYMVNNTVMNNGTIHIKHNNKSIVINPSQITNYIDKTLLSRQINTKFGTMTAKKYIEEIYSQFIPEDGIIYLKNGLEITVQKYIEDFLIQYINNFNGDIAQFLTRTINNNNGSFTPLAISNTLNNDNLNKHR